MDETLLRYCRRGAGWQPALRDIAIGREGGRPFDDQPVIDVLHFRLQSDHVGQ